MCTAIVPHNEWREFLRSLTTRHSGRLVSIQTHDRGTGETVTSRCLPLESLELDLEDRHNPRINVNVRDREKQIKHIFFRPSEVMLQVSTDGNHEGIRIISVNTVTTIRFRVEGMGDFVDRVA